MCFAKRRDEILTEIAKNDKLKCLSTVHMRMKRGGGIVHDAESVSCRKIICRST